MKPNDFINPQEAEEKAAARYQTLFVLWAGIFGSLALMLGLTIFTSGVERPNPALTIGLLAAGLMSVVASLLIKARLVSQAIEKRDPAVLQSGYVLGFALTEAAALFAVVDHFITGSRYYYVGFVAAAIGMLIHFPKKEHVRATI